MLLRRVVCLSDRPTDASVLWTANIVQSGRINDNEAQEILRTKPHAALAIDCGTSESKPLLYKYFPEARVKESDAEDAPEVVRPAYVEVTQVGVVGAWVHAWAGVGPRFDLAVLRCLRGVVSLGTAEAQE